MNNKLSPIQLDNYRPLREIVFDVLRQAIIDGTLEPGERLMEVQLAEALGVSRTPVREALRQLELEGFIVMVPRKGAYVADLSTKDVADVLEIRGALEALAASLAAERIEEEELELLERLLVESKEAAKAKDIEQMIKIDTRFHDILYQASRNKRLVQIVSNLSEQIQRYRTTSLAYPGRLIYTLKEHRLLVDALAERNADLASELAQEHIENVENVILEMLSREKKEMPQEG
jgi:DNA-binding GntR family transcriptional regulator